MMYSSSDRLILISLYNRSQALGASMVTAFAELVPHLRGPLGEEGERLVAKAKEETKAKGSNWYKESV